MVKWRQYRNNENELQVPKCAVLLVFGSASSCGPWDELCKSTRDGVESATGDNVGNSATGDVGVSARGAFGFISGGNVGVEIRGDDDVATARAERYT